MLDYRHIRRISKVRGRHGLAVQLCTSQQSVVIEGDESYALRNIGTPILNAHLNLVTMQI